METKDLKCWKRNTPTIWPYVNNVPFSGIRSCNTILEITAVYRTFWNCTMSIPICSPVSNIKSGIRTVTVMKDDSGLHAELEAQIATWILDDG